MGSLGQAMTEMVILVFMCIFFLFGFAKIFALLVLVQKLEIGSYYAARRWQLESHRNVNYEGFDDGALKYDIRKHVECYIGFARPECSENESVQNFLSLDSPDLQVQRTQVWNIVSLKVSTKPLKIPFWDKPGLKFDLEVKKYVPNRDRPIAFVLPGLQQ